MKQRSLLTAFAVLIWLLVPNVAGAQTAAFTVPGGGTLRAGPGQDYPVVARILGGSGVTVIGCLSDFSWCDSQVQGIRGWVSTTRLEFIEGGTRIAAPQYRRYNRPPLVRFDLGYWDRFYRNRPFYRERRRDRGEDVYIDPDQSRDGSEEVYIDPDQSDDNDRGVYIDPDQNPRTRVGTDERDRNRVLGKVTDRPGYCYFQDASGQSIIAECP